VSFLPFFLKLSKWDCANDLQRPHPVETPVLSISSSNDALGYLVENLFISLMLTILQWQTIVLLFSAIL